MPDIGNGQHTEGSTRGWVMVFCVAALFLAWSLFIFFTVGVKWPPVWDFGGKPEVPGLSIYSTHPTKKGQPQAAAALHEGDALAPQHVREPPAAIHEKEPSE